MRLAVLIFTLLFLTACSAPKVDAAHPIIATYSGAYNDKDIATMSALMHPDIEWLSVEGGVITVEVEGKIILTEAMKGYFSDPKLPRGSLRDWSINGDSVSYTHLTLPTTPYV